MPAFLPIFVMVSSFLTCEGRVPRLPRLLRRPAKSSLGKNVIGVVLNSVQEEALAYGSYYRSGYYGHDRAKEPDGKPVPLSEAP